MRIKKGDEVIILSGNQKGQTGKVERVLPKDGRLVITGINIRTKHKKPSGVRQVGGREKREQAIDASNVALIRPGKKSAGTRLGVRLNKSGQKVRTAKQAGNKEIK